MLQHSCCIILPNTSLVSLRHSNYQLLKRCLHAIDNLSRILQVILPTSHLLWSQPLHIIQPQICYLALTTEAVKARERDFSDYPSSTLIIAFTYHSTSNSLHSFDC